MTSSRITCFVLALIFSGQVTATEKDVTSPERLRTMGTLIRGVGHTCIPTKVSDAGITHDKHFYRVKCEDGQNYMVATQPGEKINDIDMTGATYIAVDDVDWQKSEWMNTIIRNSESLDNILKSHPDILE